MSELEANDEFVNEVMHNLRTPLTSIKGFADLLTRKEVLEDADARERYLMLLNKNINKLCGTIGNLGVVLNSKSLVARK